LTSRCGTVTGNWVGTVFRDSLNRIWVTGPFLREEFGSVIRGRCEWNRWLNGPCADLPRDVNDGKIRSAEVPAPKVPQGRPRPDGWVRVWCYDDAQTIVTRRINPDARKKGDPDNRGRWITDQIFQLTRDMGPSDPPTVAGLLKDDLLLRDKL